MDRPYYSVDTETHTWLEQIMHLAAGVADLQTSPEACDDIYNLLAEVSERFGIDSEPFRDDLPEAEPEVIHFGKPRLTVIDGNPAKKDTPVTTD